MPSWRCWPAFRGAVWTVPVAPLWAQLAGLLAAVLAILPLPWRARLLALPLALALLVPPRRPAGRGQLRPARRRRRPGHRRAGPHPRPRAAVRHRAAVLARKRRRPARAGAAAARPRRRAARPARAQPSRRRPRRRRRGACSARSAVDALPSSLEPAIRCTAAARRGRRAARPASAGAGTASSSRSCARPPTTTRARCKPNAMSCVLRVAGGGRSVLLTGDIERDQEAAARRRARRGAAERRPDRAAPRQQDLVVGGLPRRGAAEVAVVQAGYRNRFGHPARRGAGALSRARHRASSTARRAAPGTGRADGADGATCQRERGAALLARRGGARRALNAPGAAVPNAIFVAGRAIGGFASL